MTRLARWRAAWPMWRACTKSSPSRAGAELQGAVSGMLTLARNLGFITATAVMALVFNLAVDRADGPSGAALGMAASFGLAAIVGVLAVSLAGSRRNGRG